MPTARNIDRLKLSDKDGKLKRVVAEVRKDGLRGEGAERELVEWFGGVDCFWRIRLEGNVLER